MRIPGPRTAFLALTLLAVTLAASSLRDSEGMHTLAPEDSEHASIVFVCQNGVAMSVWSALTFDRLAAERGLRIRAAARAAAPTFTHVPLRMKLALALDGFGIGGYRPQVIRAADVRRADLVILIETELPSAVSAADAAIERWGGFPPMRERYFASRAALRTRVEDLVARLAASADSSP